MRKNYIFTNYDTTEREEYTREYLLETIGEENEWKTVDDIPDNAVYEEMNFQEEIEWEDAMTEMRSFFKGKKLLVVGTCGLWYGNRPAGAVIDYDDLYKCWNNCAYIEIYDEGGHLYINGTHHDGTNCYEVKILTEKGVEMWDKWNYEWKIWQNDDEKTVHEKLWESSHYSHIPHFAREVYGCKTR